jgi:hypothetical protein
MYPRSKRRKQYLDPATWLIIKQIGLGLLSLAVVASVIASVWYLTRLQSLTINEVKVEGGVTLDKNILVAAAEAELEGEYVGLIPKRFTYFYPEEEIYEALSEIDRVKTVEVKRDGGQVVNVKFTEYLPDNLWCDLADDMSCLFLDENAYAFTEAPVLVGGSLVRYFNSEDVPVKGGTVLEVSDYNKTKEFADSLEEISWYVKSVEVNSARDVFYGLSEGGEIRASLNDNPSNILSNLNTVISSKEFAHLKPGNFNYLDLRFGTRVFVNEEMPQEETDEATASSTEDVLNVSDTETN